jgi:hypothetical protein
MNRYSAATATVLVIAFFACTRTTLTAVETAADQAAAEGCDLIFLPTDPSLAPLCVGIADVVAAGAALGLDLLGIADAGAPDGAVVAARAQLVVHDPVTNARVYAWLVAHGAVRLGG